jgi:hypothetical protein
VRERKKKEGGGGRGPLREGKDGPVGRLGQKGGKVLFLFVLFHFQTLFKSNLFNSNANQNFSNFFTTFDKPF